MKLDNGRCNRRVRMVGVRRAVARLVGAPALVSTLTWSLTSLVSMLLVPIQLLGASNVAAAESGVRPTLPLLSAQTIDRVCPIGLASLRARVSTIEAQPPAHARDAKQVFKAWNDLQIALEDLQGPIEILNNVSPEPAIRANAEKCLVEINRFTTNLMQSAALYARFKAIKPQDAIEAKLRKDTLENFKDTGVALPAAKRRRMNIVLGRLDELKKQFSRTIRDNNTKVVFTSEEMQGLPDSYLSKAKRDAQGRYVLGFDYPSYNPFMEYADNAQARKRYQTAFANRGTPKNLETLKEAMTLRHEMAGLFGLPSYSDFVTRHKMAGTSQAVYRFLDDVSAAVEPIERRELDALRNFRASASGVSPAEAKIERWDLSYWQQKLKTQRYAIDQNTLRKYFPSDAVIPWIMQVSSTLYGIEFRQAEVPVWHPDVRYFDVVDGASKARIGGVYLDMFPREGKYGHAAVWPIRGASTLARRTPISVLVTNFDRTGLDGNELETLVHEFGHVLHGVLSHTRYLAQSGTSVERDFVEAPSQMYEEWARALEPLAMIANFCTTPCPRVDGELVQRLNAAHNFGRSIRYARQLLYARYDMDLHGSTLVDPLPLWERMESATLLGHTPDTQFPGQFDHLMNGYGAGYYGYMWSEVLALDMLSRYQGKLMNPVVGRRYRDTILSRGSEVKGADMVRAFLGREAGSKAFFDEISGQRLR